MRASSPRSSGSAGCRVRPRRPPALGSHIQCGDVIAQDTTLDSDLIDCPGNGIVIGSPDITVDLNGHTIDGDDSGLEDHGIDNGAGEDAVTVRGPGPQEFANGVR